jgi:hypothetical protein
MAERKPISKKVRFDVFKRDGFACQYCGCTPPAVVLEIDHIHPVAKGGTNQVDNLLTACFDCNRGKSAGLLTVLPETVAEKAELMAEKLEQIKAYHRLVKSKKRLEEQHVDEVEEAFRVHFPENSFTPKFRESVRLFIQKLPAHTVADYMHLACSRIRRPEDAVKYFCGICWKTIKGTAR